MPRGPLASIPSPARSVWHLGPVPLRAQELAIVAGVIVAIVVADRRYRNAGGPGRADPRRRRRARRPRARRAVAGHPPRRLDPRLPRRGRPRGARRLARLPPGAIARPGQIRAGARPPRAP